MKSQNSLDAVGGATAGSDIQMVDIKLAQ
jgi:hypothetical protein